MKSSLVVIGLACSIFLASCSGISPAADQGKPSEAESQVETKSGAMRNTASWAGIWTGTWNASGSVAVISVWSGTAEARSASGVQIADILAKMEQGEKEQFEQARNATGTLVQGDFRAEYVSNDYDVSKADSIVITKNGVKKSIPWIHPNPTPTRSDPEFDFISTLVEFSPDGKYILYQGACDMSCPGGIIDTESGKRVLEFENLAFHGWTSDGRFIFATVFREGCPGGFLSITGKDNPSNAQNILDMTFLSAYIENGTMYVHVSDRKKICEENDRESLKAYDLETLTEMFSKEIR